MFGTKQLALEKAIETGRCLISVSEISENRYKYTLLYFGARVHK